MLRNFTLEYWIDEEWYVGRLKEVPGVFSQGETFEELERNIKDAYKLMMEEEEVLPFEKVERKEEKPPSPAIRKLKTVSARL